MALEPAKMGRNATLTSSLRLRPLRPGELDLELLAGIALVAGLLLVGLEEGSDAGPVLCSQFAGVVAHPPLAFQDLGGFLCRGTGCQERQENDGRQKPLQPFMPCPIRG